MKTSVIVTDYYQDGDHKDVEFEALGFELSINCIDNQEVEDAVIAAKQLERYAKLRAALSYLINDKTVCSIPIKLREKYAKLLIP